MRPLRGDAPTTCGHRVQFYDTEAFLLSRILDFISPALRDGGSALVIATRPHLRWLRHRLDEAEHGPVDSDRFIGLDARDTLDRFMVEGRPDPERFTAVVGALLQQASDGGARRVSAFGEMVALLYTDGNTRAAIELERLWEAALAECHEIGLLCAYPMTLFPDATHSCAFRAICETHSHVDPLALVQDAAGTADLHRTIARLQQEANSLRSSQLTEQELLRSRQKLDLLLRERNAELARANAALRNEIAERKAAEDKIRQLLGRLVDAQEDERRRLSCELHDTLGQDLAVQKLGLRAIMAEEVCPPRCKGRLSHIEQATRRLEKNVDRLSYDLRSPALDGEGLMDALSQQVCEWSAETGVAVDFQAYGLRRERLSDAIETTVYRVVQESLSNVRKHAGASRVSLIVKRLKSELRVIVEDDGCGFDTTLSSAGPHGRRRLGLLGMAERAVLVAGRLWVESEPGKGSTVYLLVPLGAAR